jgi:hypothetical protein
VCFSQRLLRVPSDVNMSILKELPAFTPPFPITRQDVWRNLPTQPSPIH